MTQVSTDAGPTVKAPTLNKTVGSVGAGLGGGGLGAIFITLLDLHYHITLTPEMASIVGSAAAVVAGGLGTFFSPIVTAGQQAILRKIQHEQ